MKNLANCKPSEFLIQTNKIRKSVEKWMTSTDIMNIRKRLPKINETMTKEDRDKALRNQMRKNFDAILNSVLEDHPQETLELLALLCFVEPDMVDDYPISDYLMSFSEIINNEAVLSFFTSLARLGAMTTSDAVPET